VQRDELARAINDRCRLTGSFLLRSGATSDVYFDKYRFEADPIMLLAVAEQLAPMVGADIDALAGLEMGGIPIATMLAQCTGKPAMFVRKQAKEYGTCKLAEGGEIERQELLVVEDVVTSGGQVVISTQELRERGAKVSRAVCVIDREAGGREKLAEIGVELVALFTRSELEG